jgi:hypothetical protein
VRAFDAAGDECERELWHRRAAELTAKIIEGQLAEVPH